MRPGEAFLKFMHASQEQKQWARSDLASALKTGKLTRPAMCSRCFESGVIEGHHPDYSKPLAVVWLCNPCHQFIHAYAEKEYLEARKSFVMNKCLGTLVSEDEKCT